MSAEARIDAVIEAAEAAGLTELTRWLTDNRARLVAKCDALANLTADERELAAQDQSRSLFIYKLD